MVGPRVLSAAYHTPWVKRLLWRSVYDFLARRYRDQRWTFMNYGYRPPEGSSLLSLAPEDEADRSCIELYNLVACACELKDAELLEIGSGRGGGASFIVRYLQPRRMVGVDVSPEAVALCRARHALPGLTFEIGDAERLNFAAASFDVVLNIESSHCYGDREAFLGEVRRVLRPSGYFLYADFRPYSELKAWRAQLRASGLRLFTERDITTGVVAALETDDAAKRHLIQTQVARPLLRMFRQFAALRGTFRYDQLRTGFLSYRVFVLQKDAPSA